MDRIYLSSALDLLELRLELAGVRVLWLLARDNGTMNLFVHGVCRLGRRGRPSVRVVVRLYRVFADSSRDGGSSAARGAGRASTSRKTIR